MKVIWRVQAIPGMSKHARVRSWYWGVFSFFLPALCRKSTRRGAGANSRLQPPASQTQGRPGRPVVVRPEPSVRPEPRLKLLAPCRVTPESCPNDK